MMRAILAGACLLAWLAASGAPQASAPVIPLCAGLTLITAVNDATGDYESIKTIESANEEVIRIRYSAQKMDYGDMFTTDPPKLKNYQSRRIVRRDDMRTSRSYLQEFAEVIPEEVPGMTALGTSAVVLEELKKKGTAEFGISFWVFVVPPGLDRNDSQSIYRKQMVATARREGDATVPVLINGVPADLPAVRARGNFLGYESEFWFLDQPDNPLTLKYRIGIGEIAPLPADDVKQCASHTRLLGYPPQHCLRPAGGDRATLDLVKINHRCESTPPPAGGATGGGSGTGGGAGTGTGTAAGAGASGELALEQALMTDGRAEISDIFFQFDSDQIREESEQRLRDIAQVLKRHPDWKLKVEGHTDSIAADDYNLKLSQRRAAAVVHALVKRFGIDAGRLTPEGLGESRPRAPNDTLYGRARNRRVELVRTP